MSERIEKLLDELTLDEKAAMVAGVDLWHTAAVERLGIPALKVTDGPIGARGARWTGGRSHAFPCGTALGATWDPALIRRVGERLGGETRRKRAHVLLAPTVNIHRHPLAGRNFECYSEDPYLTARIAVGYIEGVQSRGVGCSVKHFVANDSEYERMTMSSEVDERTLREIYLPQFEAAVREAGAWSVMTAYNRLNGTFCSEHPWLVDELLKREWAFDGFVVSDWYGTHSTVPAANAGLDVEMPGPAQWFGENLARAIGAGEVDEKTLDEKVRRVLRVLERAGAFENPDPGPEESVDDPEDRAVAREAAAASFVLLKNDGRALPLAMTRQLAIIGPNSDIAHVMGGGSARVPPHTVVSALEGIRARFESEVAVTHERGCSNHKRTPYLDTRFLDGLVEVAYYAGREFEGEPVLVEDSQRGYFTWLGPVGANVPEEFSVRIRANLVVSEAGEWKFSLVQAGRARLRLDGEMLVDNWQPKGRSDAFFGLGSEELATTLTLVEGARHEIEVEFIPAAPGVGGLAIGLAPPVGSQLLERAVAAAAAADAVVCIVGLDGDWETEGNDRETINLPGPQDELIRAVAAVNGNTIVVVNAGSPIAMPWRDDVAAILQGWYAGEEWGNALADVLSGDVNPSGKLPTTFPVRLEDTPAFTNYPGERGKVHYGEGVFVGYRWYDARDVEPAFCFGHGLSYSKFEIGDVEWNAPELQVKVTNSSARPGAEVIQCYVHDVEASVARPPQELKAFSKVMLEAFESKTVTLTLDRDAFAFWDSATSAWFVEPGEFELRIGTSSRDIHQRLTITVNE